MSGSPPKQQPAAKGRKSPLILLLILGLLTALILPLVRQRQESDRRTESRNNLKMIGLAASNYDDSYHTLPPWGTVGAEGKPLHGWQLLIHPHLEASFLFTMVDRGLAWDHPRNAFLFRNVIPNYLNPGESEVTDERGFALSHYAGNSEVLGAGHSARMEYNTKGQSHTVLFGEVGDSYKPWGQPDNTRQASAPLNSGPNSFGRYSRDGALLCMADGSVRFVANSVDAAVLSKPKATHQNVFYSTYWVRLREGLRAETQRKPEGNLIAVLIPYHDNGDEGVPSPSFPGDQDILFLEPLDHLETLHVRDGIFTDALLKRLGEIPSLQYIGVSGTEITDAGLAQLERLQNLKLLQIAAPRVTEAAVLRLKRALPKCDVRHSAGTGPEERKPSH